MVFAEVDWLGLGIILTLGVVIWIGAKVGKVVIGSSQGQGIILGLLAKMFNR